MVNQLHYIPGYYNSDKQTASDDKGKSNTLGYSEDGSLANLATSVISRFLLLMEQ